jgi:hypothetical protein
MCQRKEGGQRLKAAISIGAAFGQKRVPWLSRRRWVSRALVLSRGRIIQSSGSLRYAIVDGLDVRDSRLHNYPPRWNAAPSQELLVIRRNHKTGEVSLDPVRRAAAASSDSVACPLSR